MSVGRHVYTVTLNTTFSTATLPHINGRVRMDEGWAPHVQASIEIHMPSQAVSELLDPRKTPRPRVVVTASCSYEGLNTVPLPSSARTFDLLLVARELNHGDATISISLESDEALLQAGGLVATAPNLTALAYQSSLRSIINNVVLAPIGAALQPGTTDAPFRVLTNATNLALLPSAEIAAPLPGTTNCTISRSTAWAASGSASYLLSAPSNADSFMVAMGPGSLQAGKTYTASATIRLTAAQSGSIYGSRSRGITVVANAGAGDYVLAESPSAPNAAGVTRVSVTFTMPLGLTGSSVRLYHGATGGSVYWDAFMVTEGTALETYFDGSTPSTTEYGYAWTGPAHQSPSTRTTLISRSSDLLKREPGQSLWDFISPLLPVVGLRLFCDEARRWWLVDAAYIAPGFTTIAAGFNVTEARDVIDSRDDSDWFDAIVIKYSWNDSANVPQVAYDVAGPASPNKVRKMEIEHPFPGRGAAAYALSRAQGKGRTQRVAAISNYSAAPTQPLTVTLPDTPIQTGLVLSVEWSLTDDVMTIETRGLTDTPPTSWLFVPPGKRWIDVPAGVTWNSYTP